MDKKDITTLSSLLEYKWTRKLSVDIALPFSLRKIGEKLFCCTKEGVISFNNDLKDRQPIITRDARPLGNYLHPAVILDVASHKDTEDKDIFIYGTQGGFLYEDQEPTQNGEEKKAKPIDTYRTRESFYSVAVDGASIYACSNTKQDYQVHKYNLAQKNIKHNLTIECDDERSFPRIALYDDGIAVMNATSGTLRFLNNDLTRNGIVEGIDDQPHLCDADQTGMLVAKFQTKKLELYRRVGNDLRIYDIQLSRPDVSPITAEIDLDQLNIFPISAVLWGNELFIAGWNDEEGLENGRILKFVHGEKILLDIKPHKQNIDMDNEEDDDKKNKKVKAKSKAPKSAKPAQTPKKGEGKETDNANTTPKMSKSTKQPKLLKTQERVTKPDDRKEDDVNASPQLPKAKKQPKVGKTPKTDEKAKKEDGIEDELSQETEKMKLQ